MPQKKAQFTMMQIIVSIGMVVGLTGGFITLENHWVSHPYHEQADKVIKTNHEADLAQLAKEIQQIQKNSAEKSAYDAVLFYNKLESDMLGVKARLGKSPSSEFDAKLKETIENRKAAEETLKKLKEK